MERLVFDFGPFTLCLSLIYSLATTVLLANSRKSKRKSSESDSVFEVFEHGDYIAKVGFVSQSPFSVVVEYEEVLAHKYVLPTDIGYGSRKTARRPE